MPRRELERRSYSFEVRAEEQDGIAILSGRPIVYNSRTDLEYFDEIIEPGALDVTDLSDVRFLVNHDISKIPLARSRRNNGNSTMQLQVDTEGLYIDWVRLDVANNAEARALYSAVQRGDITGMSIMFSISGEKWDNLESDHPTRHITKISSVVEVSACTFPAYSATEIYARSEEALESASRVLENARNAHPLESGQELELAKARFDFLAKM